MENNTFNVSEIYVGKVISVQLDTHELEVYIPKLMPTLNYGFSDTTYSIGLQGDVIKKNTLLCQPVDFKIRVPDKDSLVHVTFLDGDIKKIYWRDFDPFGTNTYIDFEKTRHEKTLEGFTDTFSVVEGNLIPNNKDVNIGSESNPISNIFGNIDSKYIIGIDREVTKIMNDISGDGTGLGKRVKILEDIQPKKADLVNGVVPLSQLPEFQTGGEGSTIITNSFAPEEPVVNLYWIDTHGGSIESIPEGKLFYQTDNYNGIDPFILSNGDEVDTSGDDTPFDPRSEGIDTSGDDTPYESGSEEVDTSGDNTPFDLNSEEVDTSGDNTPFDTDLDQIDTSGDVTPYGSNNKVYDSDGNYIG